MTSRTDTELDLTDPSLAICAAGKLNEIADKFSALRTERDVLAAEFKSFHRLLCERFGYGHDEKDWRRDQLSLIEHIAAQLAHTEAALESMQNKYASRPLDHPSGEALLAENERLEAALARAEAESEAELSASSTNVDKLLARLARAEAAIRKHNNNCHYEFCCGVDYEPDKGG